MDDFSSPAAQWFMASGPFGIVGILSYALWKINEKKDAALREIYERVAEMSATQTKAIVRMESALVKLKESIERLYLQSYSHRNKD